MCDGSLALPMWGEMSNSKGVCPFKMNCQEKRFVWGVFLRGGSRIDAGSVRPSECRVPPPRMGRGIFVPRGAGGHEPDTPPPLYFPSRRGIKQGRQRAWVSSGDPPRRRCKNQLETLFALSFPIVVRNIIPPPAIVGFLPPPTWELVVPGKVHLEQW